MAGEGEADRHRRQRTLLLSSGGWIERPPAAGLWRRHGLRWSSLVLAGLLGFGAGYTSAPSPAAITPAKVAPAGTPPVSGMPGTVWVSLGGGV